MAQAVKQNLAWTSYDISAHVGTKSDLGKVLAKAMASNEIAKADREKLAAEFVGYLATKGVKAPDGEQVRLGWNYGLTKPGVAFVPVTAAKSTSKTIAI